MNSPLITVLFTAMITFCLPLLAQEELTHTEQSAAIARSLKPFLTKAKSGQILALSETGHDGATFFFEAMTGSRFGHIGIVMLEGGIPYVYEANPPYAIKVTMEEFLKRSLTPELKVQATLSEVVTPLTTTELNNLSKKLNTMIKSEIPYDYLHNALDSSAMDCSEFVYSALKFIGREVGRLESLEDLHTNSFKGILLESLQALTGTSFNSTQRFISPAIIIRDVKLKPIHSTLPIQRILSDLEILDAWYKVGGLPKVIQILNPVISEDEVSASIEQTYHLLKSEAHSKPYKINPVPELNMRCADNI